MSCKHYPSFLSFESMQAYHIIIIIVIVIMCIKYYIIVMWCALCSMRLILHKNNVSVGQAPLRGYVVVLVIIITSLIWHDMFIPLNFFIFSAHSFKFQTWLKVDVIHWNRTLRLGVNMQKLNDGVISNLQNGKNTTVEFLTKCSLHIMLLETILLIEKYKYFGTSANWKY